MIRIGEFVKKFNLTFFFLLMTTFGLSIPAAAEVNVTAKLAPSVITVDEEAIITLAVGGNQSTSEPVAPRVAGLSIVLTGRSSQINIFNSQMQGSVEYQYTIVPSDPGEYPIPAFVVYSSGVEYRSTPLKLSVKPAGTYSSKPSSPFSNSPNPNYRPQMPDDASQAGQNFWISTTVSQTNPYQYEEILFRFKLFTRVNLEFEELKLPAFKDFRMEELVPEKKGKQVVGGVSYSTYEIVYALYPLKSGKLTIEETRTTLKYYVQNRQNTNSFFFGYSSKPRVKTISANPIEIDVKPLPDPIPHDFTGLVGQFDLAASLSDHTLNVGDSATLSVTLSGQGNIRDARLPELGLKGFKVYTDKPVEQVDKTQNGMRGSKTFTLALMPTEAVEINLGGFSVSYLDPGTEVYTHLKFPDMVFAAKGVGSASAVATIAGGQTPDRSEILLKDLSPLVASPELALGVFALPLISERLALLFFFGLPGLFFSVWAVIFAKNAYFKPTRRGQMRKAWRGLSHKLKITKGNDPELWESLKDFFARLMDLKTGSVTAAEMRLFCNQQFGEKHSEEVKTLGTLFDKIEASQYGFTGLGLNDGERATLKKLLQRLL